MGDKLIEIAKSNGAECFTDHIDIPVEVAYVFTPDQLRATIEQVCAPLVRYAEALELLEVITGIESQGYSALNAYSAIIGDKS